MSMVKSLRAAHHGAVVALVLRSIAVSSRLEAQSPQSQSQRTDTIKDKKKDGDITIAIVPPPCEGTCEDLVPPTVIIRPWATTTRNQREFDVNIEMCDSLSTFTQSTYRVWRNGVNVTSSFPFTMTHVNNVPPGCNDHATARSRVTLAEGSTSFLVEIRDASNNRGWDSTAYTFKVIRRGLTVTPVGTTITPSAGSSGTQLFTVRNTGNAPDAVTITPFCTGAAIGYACGGGAPRIVTLDSGATTVVSLTYTAQYAAGPAARLGVRARGASTTDSGWVNVVVAGPAATSTTVTVVGLGTTVEKDQCLVFGLVSDVANECGVLRVTHGLPGIRTLNKARAPTLVYYYDQAASWATVAVRIALGPSSSTPTSIRTTLYERLPDGGLVQKAQRTDLGSAWATGSRTNQVVLRADGLGGGSTRVFPYQVVVEKLPAGPFLGEFEPVDGELVLVRREMAAGWHVAGVEELYPGQLESGVLWVGGDGSTRMYSYRLDQNGDRIFTAPTIDRPDTLRQNIASGLYSKRLPGGVRVEFDATGLHRRTVNRLGHETAFDYVSGTRKLSTITVPPASAGLVYTFHYSSSGGGLDSVVGHGFHNGRRRTVRFDRTMSNGTTSQSAFSRIIDADSSAIGFEYTDCCASGLIGARIDRRGTRTTLVHETTAPTLASSSTPANATQTIVQSFRSVQNQGGDGAAPVPVDSVFVRHTGPRGFSSRFWLNDLGAPIVVIDPVSRETRVERDPARPGLVVRTTAPNGLVSTAAYDARGNVDSTVSFNPLGDGRNAITRFDWPREVLLQQH